MVSKDNMISVHPSTNLIIGIIEGNCSKELHPNDSENKEEENK